MKNKLLLLGTALLVLMACPVFARDRKVAFPLRDALESDRVKKAVIEEVELYWGEQRQSEGILQHYGNFKAEQRTAILERTREEACEWALAGAIKKLQGAASRQKANAVVNITSALPFSPYRTSSDFDCAVGGFMVKVALRGDIVLLGPMSPETPKTVVQSNSDREQIIAVQKKLSDMGYITGEADGIVAQLQQFRKALARYQEDNGLRVTGEPDAETVEMLLSTGTTAKMGVADGISNQDAGSRNFNRLYKLYKDGAITEEEYTLLKEKALEKYSPQ